MSLATLTNTGRAAIASAIASRPLHLAWGTGDPAWDADDASLPSLVNATARSRPQAGHSRWLRRTRRRG